jgi:hypothetical protein
MNPKTQYFIYLIIILVAAAIFMLVVRGKNNGISDRMEFDKYFNFSWASDKIWEDGKAEVAIYDAERNVYGKIRSYEYVCILVKETFNSEYQVKTDDYSRNDLFDVMKINKFARIETDKYPYHYLSSLFLTREDPVHLYKFTHSSQEWCGNTFKHIGQQNNQYEYHYDSYWDQEGRGSTSLPPDVLFEDQLSYTLRTLNFKNGTSFGCRIVESQITNKATTPRIYDATISVNKNDENPEGLESYDPKNIWEIRVQLDTDKNNYYWIDGSSPNELLKMTAWDGRKLILKRIYRDAYWQHE